MGKKRKQSQTHPKQINKKTPNKQKHKREENYGEKDPGWSRNLRGNEPGLVHGVQISNDGQVINLTCFYVVNIMCVCVYNKFIV